MVRIILSNKLKFTVSLLLIAGAFLFVFNNRGKADKPSEGGKKVVEVKVKKGADVKNYKSTMEYPGTVVGDQEVSLVSQVSGIVNAVNFDLGSQVFQGKILVSVDDQGGILGIGENNFRSVQIQQLELTLRQAKESRNLAKRNYNADKSKTNKTAYDIAKLEYESAEIGLNNALNAHSIMAPISGTVASRQISVGETVVPGQVLATISRTNRFKIQFFLSAREVLDISRGTEIKVVSEDKKISAKVINISPQADPATKRFLVEAMPEAGSRLLFGTVVSVFVETNKNAKEKNSLILPLSAISNTQTENSIFIAVNGITRKIPLSILEIFGEMAIVSADLTDDSDIIIEGNKLIQDGDPVQIVT